MHRCTVPALEFTYDAEEEVEEEEDRAEGDEGCDEVPGFEYAVHVVCSPL